MRRTIVDGYNLLFRSESEGRALSEAREDLLRRIDAARRPGELVIVVFDGRPGPSPRARLAEGLEVRFASSPRTADDLIVRLVGSAPRRQTRVLTRDRELASRVRSAGGVVVAPQEWLRPPARRTFGPPASRSEKPRPPTGTELDEWERMFREREDDP